jgi:hypothetical protein
MVRIRLAMVLRAGNLFFWGRVAVRLLPRRDILDGFSKLVEVPMAFGGWVILPWPYFVPGQSEALRIIGAQWRHIQF